MRSELSSGWIKSQLCNLAADKPFAIVDGPFGTQLHHDEYVSDGVPVVRIVNLSYDGRFLNDDLVFITERKAEELSRSTVNQHDIIIAKTGATIGKLGMFPVSYERGIIASSCLKITPNPNLINPKYLLHLLTSEYGQRAIVNGAIGSTRATINITPFGKIEVYHPIDTNEQRRIVEILDTISDAIRKTEAVIAKLRQLRAGLLHDLLTRGLDENGELRDPIAHPEQFQDSPIGRIPRSWEMASISSLLADVPFPMRSGPFGSALLKDELVDSGIPVLGIDNVYVEEFVRAYTRFLTERKFNELLRYKVRPCDIMITIMGTVGRSCVVPDNIGDAISSKHVWTLTLDQRRYSPPLACWQFNYAPWVLSHFKRDEQGGVMSAIRSETLKTTLLPVPSEGEMIAIEGFLLDSASKILIEETTKSKLSQIRYGLMFDLLTGRVRVAEGII